MRGRRCSPGLGIKVCGIFHLPSDVHVAVAFCRQDLNFRGPPGSPCLSRYKISGAAGIDIVAA
jgi:hypothetical protein